MSKVRMLFAAAISVPTSLGVSVALAGDNEARQIAVSAEQAMPMSGEAARHTVTFVAGDTEQGTVTFLAGEEEGGTVAFVSGDYRSINNTVNGEFGP